MISLYFFTPPRSINTSKSDVDFSAFSIKRQKFKGITPSHICILTNLFSVLWNFPRSVHLKSRRWRGQNTRGWGGISDAVVRDVCCYKRLVFFLRRDVIWMLGNIELQEKVDHLSAKRSSPCFVGRMVDIFHLCQGVFESIENKLQWKRFIPQYV